MLFYAVAVQLTVFLYGGVLLYILCLCVFIVRWSVFLCILCPCAGVGGAGTALGSDNLGGNKRRRMIVIMMIGHHHYCGGDDNQYYVEVDLQRDHEDAGEEG